MNMLRRSGGLSLVRFLVILGAVVGVFGLHNMSLDTEATPVPETQPVVQFVASQVDAHAASERLEQVAMAAPSLVASDPDAGRHHGLPCVAFVVGSLLLLAARVLQQRQRFADGPGLNALTRLVLPPRQRCWDTRRLDVLCVLRT